MRKSSGLLALALLSLAGCHKNGDAGSAKLATSGVTDAMLTNASDNEWLSYGRDSNEQRFSPLTAINDQNVGQLGLEWSADLDTARGQEATPLMHDGMLYVTTAWSKVNAYDAKTGQLKWSYDPKVPREVLVHVCCDAVNRGAALYGDKLYFGSLDGRLIALDAKTGKEVFAKKVVPNDSDYAITGAPRIAKGRVLIGAAGGEYKARGYLAAYDAETGAEVWKFYTVPGDPSKPFEDKAQEAAAKTWSGEWWKYGGGGTVWDSIVYDPKTNLVYFGTGNAEPWNPGPVGRKGDSLYTSSIVAVNADTGAYAWHFQETPQDRWDFDSDAPITVADLKIGGQDKHVVMHAPKNGHVYLIDAKSGQFLSAKAFTTVNWATSIDPKTGAPTFNPDAMYEKTGKPWISLPGALGAHSWQPQSFSPKTGLLYIPANDLAYPYLGAKDWKATDIGFQTGLDAGSVAMPADPKARAGAAAATTGKLIAWDPVTQTARWTVKYEGPWNGGVLSTAGNLVFQGTAGGTFAAFSADKGSKLWSFGTQSGVIAAPMTYAIDGQQYVAIMVGWGGVYDLSAGTLANKSGAVRNISRLMVFKLGAKGVLPAIKPLAQLVLDPPAFKGTAEQAAHGAAVFGRYCAVCHGDAAVAGGLVPDLRHSGAINSPDAIRSVVIDGALQHNGMVSFKTALKPEDVEDVRQYVIKRANEDKKLGMK
ncbi:PQQ-dependent dehydrogenase, methanol/ethanol family [Novosphingobium sp.]|uniref:PQQ-dependent dehydrogenase, methanol/ethanol family n=1 Tax=Novosphingobium sp. TaxID=1874826 RepID=UPI0025FA1D97|nr:PQQ-dependent dehydrogenase, methanol/ethanol family [Novosphingobium sp.]